MFRRLTLLHSERPKLYYTISAFLSAIGLKRFLSLPLVLYLIEALVLYYFVAFFSTVFMN